MKRFVTTLVLLFCILHYALCINKPWTFWYWMYGAVSEQGIKADLQAMKDGLQNILSTKGKLMP